MSKPRLRGLIAAAALALAAPAAGEAQVGGNLAALPAVDLRLSITTGEDGAPVLSQSEFQLVTGEYYRFNLSSDGRIVWRVEANDLLQNSHLRLVTVGGIELHMQSLVFRAIEFDEAGAASFTFTPIRPGRYALTVGRDPASIGRRIGQAGLAGDKTATATIVVR